MARYGTVECPRCGAGTKIEVVGLARFDCHECGVQLLVSGGGMKVYAKEDTQTEDLMLYKRRGGCTDGGNIGGWDIPDIKYLRNERRDMGCKYDCGECDCYE